MRRSQIYGGHEKYPATGGKTQGVQKVRPALNDGDTVPSELLV